MIVHSTLPLKKNQLDIGAMQPLDIRLTADSMERGRSFTVALPLHSEHCSRNRLYFDHFIRNVAS